MKRLSGEDNEVTSDYGLATSMPVTGSELDAAIGQVENFDLVPCTCGQMGGGGKGFNHKGHEGNTKEAFVSKR